MTEQNTAPVITDQKPRCWRCKKILGEAFTRPWTMWCSRCKAYNGSPKED